MSKRRRDPGLDDLNRILDSNYESYEALSHSSQGGRKCTKLVVSTPVPECIQMTKSKNAQVQPTNVNDKIEYDVDFDQQETEVLQDMTDL